MSDERNDDEILGRALSRAIETQDAEETPYDRSRVAVRPLRRGLPVWQMLGAAAVLVLAVAFGAWFTRPTDQGPVAASSAPATTNTHPGTTNTPAESVPPSASPRTQVDHAIVYFARDGLPPVAAPQQGLAPLFASGHTSAEERITVRIGALHGATPPTGAINAFPGGSTNPISLRGGMPAVQIQGDLVTLDFNVPGSDWRVRGAAQSLALLQQIVYTATEEPGIARVFITENGGKRTRIDQLAIDKPLAREDVFGYASPGDTASRDTFGAQNASVRIAATSYVVHEEIGLIRFSVDTNAKTLGPSVAYPPFSVTVTPNADPNVLGGAKWRMRIAVDAATDAQPLSAIVDQTPLRAIQTTLPRGLSGGVIYDLGLDDLRPWRLAIGTDPLRIIVDIGGDPRTINADNAVYAPTYGLAIDHSVGSIVVAGVEHNFEAGVDIRIKDAQGNILLRTNTTGTNCCYPGGTFNTLVNLPAGVSGQVFLEVYQASAKDGNDTVLIRIPIVVR